MTAFNSAYDILNVHQNSLNGVGWKVQTGGLNQACKRIMHELIRSPLDIMATSGVREGCSAEPVILTAI